MLTLITLPDNVATGTLNIAGGLLTDFSPLWMMILGVLIFVAILVMLIRAFSHH